MIDNADALGAVSSSPKSGCINCGDENDGAYEVEDGPGPFCEECWDRLESYFAKADPVSPSLPNEKVRKA